jgi:hypothetical protein
MGKNFLSNLYPVEIWIPEDRMKYSSVENAYQALKGQSPAIKKEMSEISPEKARTQANFIPSPEGWDGKSVMKKLLLKKFRHENPDLLKYLLSANRGEIILIQEKENLENLLLETKEYYLAEKKKISEKIDSLKKISLVAQNFYTSEKDIRKRMENFGLLQGFEERSIEQTENWKDVEYIMRRNPGKPIEGRPFHTPMPSLHQGKAFQIIHSSGKEMIAFFTEGKYWRSKEKEIPHAEIAAWRVAN